jgi:hypothetical protein
MFSNLFRIAPHFVPYALPNIVLLEPTDLGPMLELETNLFEYSKKPMYKISNTSQERVLAQIVSIGIQNFN